jgi:TRAP transporter TAXI family solute receptor
MQVKWRFQRWMRDGGLAALGLLAIALATLYMLGPARKPPVVLTLTAGSHEGTRALLAEAMVEHAKARGIDLRPVETSGSEEALDRLDAGSCDLALVQGGLKPRGSQRVRQVAALHIEPLHLLVKPEIATDVVRRLQKLKGKRINLGALRSGTYCLGSAVLAFAGLESDDYVAETHSYAELMAEQEAASLPDAVFTVSTLPSKVTRHLVSRHGYRLVGLPFAEAFALSTLGESTHQLRGDPIAEVRREHTYDTVIPAFTYGVEPDVPPEPTHTLGTRLLLVSHDSVPKEVIERLLEVIFASRFSQLVYPPLSPELLSLQPELEPHAGTTAYLRRNQPLIAGDFVDLAEKWFSMVGVTAGGAVCLWQWLRRRARLRQDRGFEAYIVKVADIERRAAAQELSAELDLAALLELRRELVRLKQEALAKFAAGELEGEALMSGFLTHVSDTSSYLTRLILHQRDNIEDAARIQGRPAEALWVEAVNRGEEAAGDTPL